MKFTAEQIRENFTDKQILMAYTLVVYLQSPPVIARSTIWVAWFSMQPQRVQTRVLMLFDMLSSYSPQPQPPAIEYKHTTKKILKDRINTAQISFLAYFYPFLFPGIPTRILAPPPLQFPSQIGQTIYTNLIAYFLLFKQSTREYKKPIDYKITGQTQLNPLILAYVKRYLPDLEKHIKILADGSPEGLCGGFTVTLLKAFEENKLERTILALDKLIDWQDELKSGEEVPNYPELNEVISSILRAQSKSGDPAEFRFVTEYTDIHRWLPIRDEIVFYQSQFEDKNKDTHIIAAIKRVDSKGQDQYYLIDANGVFLGNPQHRCAMVSVTANPAEAQKFIRSGLNFKDITKTKIYRGWNSFNFSRRGCNQSSASTNHSPSPSPSS